MVKFQTQQPVNSPALSTFPKEMQGTFVDNESDTLYISECCIEYTNDNISFSEGKERLVKDSLELRKLGKDYLLNIKDDKYWQIVLFKCGADQIHSYYMDIESLMDKYAYISDVQLREKKVFDKLKAITSVKKMPEGEEYFYLINPNNEQLKKLVNSDFFTEVNVLTRISK
jgi:hypothetical protein